MDTNLINGDGENDIERSSKDPLGLGAWLKRIRTRAGKSQAAFGKILGVSEPVITLAESGERPASTKLVALATYYSQRDDPLDSIAKVWSQALDREVKVERPVSSWVYRMEPILVDADPATIELAIKLVEIAVASAKAQREIAEPPPQRSELSLAAR